MIDFEAVTKAYEQELLDHWAEWEPRFEAESDHTSKKYSIRLWRRVRQLIALSAGLHCLYRIELVRL